MHYHNEGIRITTTEYHKQMDENRYPPPKKMANLWVSENIGTKTGSIYEKSMAIRGFEPHTAVGLLRPSGHRSGPGRHSILVGEQGSQIPELHL